MMRRMRSFIPAWENGLREKRLEEYLVRLDGQLED
jgi:hypothetical protein